MTDPGHPKISILVPSEDLETLQPRDVIRMCTGALQEISNILTRSIVDKESVLYNDKSAAKLLRKYVDDAVYWATKM
jgi:hypothetical protein